jgi:hypothetical protein
MNPWRRHPGFASALLALGIVAIGAGGWLCAEMRRARHERAKLAARRNEWRALQRGGPSLTSENLARMEAGLQLANERVIALENALRGETEETASMQDDARPPGGTDTYFAIATFVAAMRSRAAQLGIALQANEHFGFAEFAHAGPSQERAARVESERRAVRQLLELLFASAPKKLVAVQRERSGATDMTTGGDVAADAAHEFFAPEPSRSLRRPDGVDAMAFRVIFEAPTSTLREFLAKLARSQRPLIVVRSVEVSLLEEAEPAPPIAATDMVPFLRATRSRFEVTVEVIDPAPLMRPAV